MLLAWGLQSLFMEVPVVAAAVLVAVGVVLTLFAAGRNVRKRARRESGDDGRIRDGQSEGAGSETRPTDPDLLSPRIALIPGRRENDAGFEVVNHTGDEIRRFEVTLTSLERISAADEVEGRDDAEFAPLLLEWRGKERLKPDEFTGSQIRLLASESRFIKVCGGSGSVKYLAAADPDARRPIDLSGGWTWRFAVRVSSDSIAPRLAHGYELSFEWDQSNETWYGLISPDKMREIML